MQEERIDGSDYKRMKNEPQRNGEPEEEGREKRKNEERRIGDGKFRKEEKELVEYLGQERRKHKQNRGDIVVMMTEGRRIR